MPLEKDADTNAARQPETDCEPSDVAIGPNVQITEYLNTKGPLSVVFEGRVCNLSLHPESGDLLFQDGKNKLLVKGRHVVFTKGSATAFKESAEQKALAEAEYATTPDPSGMREFIASTLENRQGLLKSPEVQAAMRDFREAMREKPRKMQEHPGICWNNSTYAFFHGRREAAQPLLWIVNFLQKKGHYDVKTLPDRRKPNKALCFNATNASFIDFLLEIAEIAKC